MSSEMNSFGTVTAPGSVRLERSLPGPIERVWSYLTDSEKRGLWLGSGEMELHVGGSVEHIFRNSELTRNDDPAPAKYAKHAGEIRLHGRITACEPPRLLAYLWGSEPDASEVRFELSEEGSRVRMVLTHVRLKSRDGMLSVSAGWHTHIAILIARLEDREPEGFWRMQTRLEAEYAQRIAADAAG